jgi:cell division protein FtsI (penicillin-binding protein 3)
MEIPPDEPVAASEPAVKKGTAPAPPEAVVVPASGPVVRGVMPDFRGVTMREALRRVEKTGVSVQLAFSGSGIAEGQKPPPGTVLHDGDVCQLTFRPLL